MHVVSIRMKITIPLIYTYTLYFFFPHSIMNTFCIPYTSHRKALLQPLCQQGYQLSPCWNITQEAKWHPWPHCSSSMWPVCFWMLPTLSQHHYVHQKAYVLLLQGYLSTVLLSMLGLCSNAAMLIWIHQLATSVINYCKQINSGIHILRLSLVQRETYKSYPLLKIKNKNSILFAINFLGSYRNPVSHLRSDYLDVFAGATFKLINKLILHCKPEAILLLYVKKWWL